jgi:hypothetical protein
MRLPFLVVVASALLGSCVDPGPVNRVAETPTRDPELIGRTELLPTSDLHTLLAVAKQTLASTAPRSPIFGVQVISQSKVHVFYGDRTYWRTGYLQLERSKGQWRVTGVKPPPQVFPDENVIVT